jgi:hypothetical protein
MILKTIILSAILSIGITSCSGEKKEETKDNNKPLTACDCAKMKRQDVPDECLEIKEKWTKEFEASDDIEKERMTKELLECVNKK